MSGLSKATRVTVNQIVGGKSDGMVDPTVELTQPGGPYGYGEAIVTDGAGGYTIAPTLRPYFLGFSVPTWPMPEEPVGCLHHGVDTTRVGLVLPLPTSLIGMSVCVDAPLGENVCAVEVFQHGREATLAELVLTKGQGAYRRDLSETLKQGVAIGVRVRLITGKVVEFERGLVLLELEA